MRATILFASALTIVGLSACNESASGTAEAETQIDLAEVDPEPTQEATGDSNDDVSVDDTGATPMEERVATIGLLNKRNNVSKDFEIAPGESVEEGPVILTLAACERTAPFEFPQETGAFVQVDVLERGDSDHTRAFSGWLFKENPSLNVVEHPIYDVWVKDCAMSFPGEE